MLVRASGLADSMSQYLIRRIEECRDITLLVGTEIVGLDGAGNLESVTWRKRDTGETDIAAMPRIRSRPPRSSAASAASTCP
jgi:thioredoxin reductase (NADPH)